MSYTGIPIIVSQGGTGSTTASGARTNLGLGSMAVQDASAVAITGGTIADITAFNALSTDAGAAAGPTIEAYRNSASPAASDLIGTYVYTGQNSTPAKITYASTTAQIDTATAGAEDSSWRLATRQSGSLVNQIIALKTGCQIRGNNTDTSPPSGYIGEQLTTGYVSGIALSTATPFNLGSLSVTPGIWMFYAFILYRTTSSVSGNTQWFCTFNTTSATLPGDGLQSVNMGTMNPRNGGNDITISHCFYTKVSATTTWYCVGQGSGSSVFNSVTGNGAFWAVRVG